MKEIYLALKPYSDGPFECCYGTCRCEWIFKVSEIARYANDGWAVYLMKDLQRVLDVDLTVTIEKKEKDDACEECPKSAEPSD